jgi:hypothetical protein
MARTYRNQLSANPKRLPSAPPGSGSILMLVSTVALPATDAAPDAVPPPTVDIVVPVYNESAGLEASIERLHMYLTAQFPFSWRVTIADNASTDGTWAIARELADRLPGVAALHLDEKGRGRALRAAWSRSDARVVAYMDVDLSRSVASRQSAATSPARCCPRSKTTAGSSTPSCCCSPSTTACG